MIYRKVFMLLVFLTLVLSNTNTQILINSDVIPKDNESFAFFISNQKNFEIGLAGKNKLWDFTALRHHSVETNTYSLASSDNRHLIDIESFDGRRTIQFKKRTFGLFEVNRTGQDPFLGYGDNDIVVKQERLDKLFFLKYQNYYNYDYEYDIHFTKDQIPSHLVNHLPPDVDSILINVFSKNELLVDAWGKLLLLNQTFEKIPRVRIKTIYTARIVYKNKEEWKELDYSNKVNLVKKYKNIIHINYQYFSVDFYDPILTIKTDENGSIKRIKYMDIEDRSKLKAQLKSKVYIHPNPNFGDFKVIFSNVKKGKYTFHVSNILGKKIWSKTYDIIKNGTFEENLSYLPRGSYIYYFKDETGNRISTRKMTILKP